MEVKLVVVKGKSKQREIPLPATIFLIGRGEKCHLRPHDGRVSKLHCAIASWAGRVLLRDLRSTNGTFLNNQRITGVAAVEDSDVLRVGGLEFRFRIDRATPPELPVPVVHEGDVRWLMDTPPDSFVLNPGCETQVTETPPGVLNSPAAQALLADDGVEGPGNPAVSAGQYFRDYFRNRR